MLLREEPAGKRIGLESAYRHWRQEVEAAVATRSPEEAKAHRRMAAYYADQFQRSLGGRERLRDMPREPLPVQD